MNRSFPAISSILSPQALAHDIVPEFGLGTVTDCRFFSGGFNHTYRLTASDGQIFYLRAYRPSWRTLADIQYELDVLDHLEQKGFPAPRVVPTKAGQRYCAVPAIEGTRYVALFTEVPGPETSYEQDPEKVARQYGQAVGQMHNALEGFGSSHNRFHKDLDHFIDKPLRYVEPFLTHRHEDWAFVQQFAETLRQRILAMPADVLEQGVCHGDLQGYHANVASDGRLGFFDFDCGGYGYRAYDLAVFLWCCRLEDAVEARWQPFLDGYRDTRSIRDLDVQAVPLFVCARYLWHMGVHTQNSPDWGIGFLGDKYFDTHLKRLRQAADDYL
ncbi:MAG: hypothetical protein E4H08_05190 [Candidatus Atribacteria bacterium]|nr:MAG: hypothetical protein E4H08_05190 [Candidatus Atribacteria bacterium]